MIAGMLPMAIGFGEGGEQTAPLGRAVIGGLSGGTVATLIILPAIFAILQRNRTRQSISLHPADRRHDEVVQVAEAVKAAVIEPELPRRRRVNEPR
jgi:hypothetical protein